MDKKYIVYIHEFPNSKVYIGVTCRKPEYRWDNGKGYAKNQRKIHNAILKYGWNNVKHKILYENLTRDQAEQKEIELIKFYNSTNDKYGYNIEKGGKLNKEISEETRTLMKLNHKGMLGKKRTQKEKEKIGLATKERWKNKTPLEKDKEIARLKSLCNGRKVWNKGIPMREETKKKLSKIRKGRTSPRKGVKLTNEQKEKISKSKKGKKLSEKAKINMKKSNANAKKIIIIETKEIYNSGKELAEMLGCHRSLPNRVCNGRTKTCRGLHMMWLSDYNKLIK